MYRPPIKGKPIKMIKSPIQRTDLPSSVDSIIKLVGELTLLKQQILSSVDSKVEEIDSKIQELDQKAKDLKELYKGDPGQDADEQKIADWIMSQITIPKDGRDGKDADEEKIVSRIAKMVPKSNEIAKEVLRLIPENKASLKIIQEKMELNPEVLMGHLEKLAPEIKKKFGIDDLDRLVKILDRRYSHGGGDTVAAGTNITITRNTNGDKVINATGGSSGLSKLTVTGTIDDSNVTFTTSAEPTYMIINGASYAAGDTSGNTIMWTNVGTTITLAFPVGSGGSISALG